MGSSSPIFGVKIKKYLSCHQPDKAFYFWGRKPGYLALASGGGPGWLANSQAKAAGQGLMPFLSQVLLMDVSHVHYIPSQWFNGKMVLENPGKKGENLNQPHLHLMSRGALIGYIRIRPLVNLSWGT